MSDPAVSPLSRVGCVLAGGRSRRMGRDKATLAFSGRLLIEHAIERLREAGCDQVFVAGSRPDLVSYAQVVPDLRPGCGPLSGIETALEGAPLSSGVLFLPVDVPLLPASFLTLLQERAERTGAWATVPVFQGEPQPLCAVYRKELLPGIRSALNAGDYKVMRVVEAIESTRDRDLFGVEAVLAVQRSGPQARGELLHRWFTNINTPEQLACLTKDMSATSSLR